MDRPRLSRISLGANGLAHIKGRLGIDEYTRNKPLRNALAGLRFEDGEAWTWALPGVTFDLDDLRDAGLPEGITQEMHWDAMTEFALAYLANGVRLAIIEDHDSSPTDPWLAKEPVLPPRLGMGNHLYWYSTSADPTQIAETTTSGFGLFKCMVLTEQKSPWPPVSPLTPVDLKGLANRADHIVVDAFDFEGFVVWSRVS
jgi:hypothetical protein